MTTDTETSAAHRDDARALHDALTRMVAMYESEFDHENVRQWRPDWLKSALARAGMSTSERSKQCKRAA